MQVSTLRATKSKMIAKYEDDAEQMLPQLLTDLKPTLAQYLPAS